ncbi:MAG: collagen-like protein [Lachnospiraceae bacterium]|nr:collagen-like protein [Lachnospiraceae bacterium]
MSEYKEIVIGNVRGPEGPEGPQGKTGDTGATGQRGSKWFDGTGITGTSTAEAVFSGSGIAEALVDDQYLNTENGNTYRCVLGGDASVAKWVYTGNLKGPRGEVANSDASLSPTSTNPVQNKTLYEEFEKKLNTDGNGSHVTAAFSAASSRNNIATGEKLSTIFGKIAKFFTDLKEVAFSGSYKDLSDTPSIPSKAADVGAAESTHDHVASNIKTGTLAGKVVANATAVATLGDKQVRNVYVGDTALESGVSALPTGDIYIKYK